MSFVTSYQTAFNCFQHSHPSYVPCSVTFNSDDFLEQRILENLFTQLIYTHSCSLQMSPTNLRRSARIFGDLKPWPAQCALRIKDMSGITMATERNSALSSAGSSKLFPLVQIVKKTEKFGFTMIYEIKQNFSPIYLKIPKISPGAYIFQRPFFKGLIFGGAYIRRGLSTEENLRFKIDLASLIVGRKFIIFALFYFAFEGNFQVQAPRGCLYLEGRFNGGFFAL